MRPLAGAAPPGGNSPGASVTASLKPTPGCSARVASAGGGLLLGRRIIVSADEGGRRGSGPLVRGTWASVLGSGWIGGETTTWSAFVNVRSAFGPAGWAAGKEEFG